MPGREQDNPLEYFFGVFTSVLVTQRKAYEAFMTCIYIHVPMYVYTHILINCFQNVMKTTTFFS